MRRFASFPVLAALVLCLVGCDHATKYAATRELRGRPPVSLIAGVAELRYTENRDIAFSLLRAVPEPVRKPLIFLGGAVALGALGLLWRQRRGAGLVEHVGFAMILAGAVGNLSDRLLRGYVVDFVHVTHWPVFNAADAWLVIGIGLLFLGERLGKARRAGPPAPEASSA